jgi:hypothetical protein
VGKFNLIFATFDTNGLNCPKKTTKILYYEKDFLPAFPAINSYNEYFPGRFTGGNRQTGHR